jgi:hypothetical protein
VPSAQEIHKAHQPGSAAALKLSLAAQVGSENRNAVSLVAQANLREGARLLLEAAGVAPDSLGRQLLQDLAAAMGDVRLSLASGKPPEIALAGGSALASRFANVVLQNAARSLGLAAGAVALSGSGGVKASLPLLNGAVRLTAEASAKGLSFAVGVAIPLIRGVALRGAARWDGRRLQWALGLAGRIQARKEVKGA